MMSCGVKKELVKSQEKNTELRNKITKLENEILILEKDNIRLFKKGNENEKKIRQLEEKINPSPKTASLNFAEVKPEFPGGNREMMLFIVRNIKYPEIAIENNVQGKVYVEFFVNIDGSISETKVLRGIGYGCDKEAIRVVNLMPNWKPGQQKGKPVRVKFRLPVSFRLQ